MKRFIFVLVLLFSLLLVFGNVSFSASPTIYWNNFEEFNYQGTSFDFLNQLVERYHGVDFGSLNWSTYSGNIDKINTFLGFFENNTYKYISMFQKSNSYHYDIYGIFSSPNVNTYYTYTIHYNSYYDYYEMNLNSSSSSGTTIRGDSDASYIEKYLIDTNNSFTNQKFYKSTQYQNVVPPSLNLKFTPSTTKYWNIDGVNFYVYEMSRNFPYISIGSLFNKSSYENVIGNLYMFIDNNNFNKFITNTRNTVDGDQVTIDTNLLLYNQGYAVNFIDGDYTTPYYYIYFVTPGTEESTFSGDIVYTGNDNNTLQPIINQNQENNDFWKETYNNFFTLSSGDANEVYNLVSSYFPSGDTPVSIYELIFGGLNNEADDFVIRWDDISYNATINGGRVVYSGDFIKASSINFSKLTRDNSTFGLVHFWIRTLAILSFCFIYFMTTYKCILLIFGVTTDFIDTSEDHRQIGFINDWRDKK